MDPLTAHRLDYYDQSVPSSVLLGGPAPLRTAAPVVLPEVEAMTVAEVKAYVEAHPDQVEAVYQAELAGKQRATLIDHLEALA